jgi:agmatine/peptidylarginine deiminase
MDAFLAMREPMAAMNRRAGRGTGARHERLTRVLPSWLLLSTLVGLCAACSPAASLPSEAQRAEVSTIRIGHTNKEPGSAAGSDHFANREVDGFPVAIIDSTPVIRVLRGDFEPPDTLVLVYEEEWLDALQQMVAATRGQANVVLLTTPEQRWAKPLLRLATQPHVKIVSSKLDSPWVRDYGPLQTYEVEGGPLWLDFGYAPDRPLDDKVPASLSTLLNARLEAPSLVLDGGAVISNGGGLCAISRTNLIDAGLTDPANDEIEVFLAGLGCRATTVLPTIPEESTGHADVVAQFLTPNLAMVAWLDPADNADISEALDQSADHLATAAALGGVPLQIMRIPIATSGETFYSYVNATRLRSRLLVPRFNNMPEEIEQSAYATLEAALPGVELVPIDADTMIQLGGAVHCVTLGLGPSAPGIGNPVRRAAPRHRPARRRG